MECAMTTISGSIPTFVAGLQPLEAGKLRDVIDSDDLPFDRDNLERLERPEETPFVRGEGDSHTVDPNDIRQGGYGSCGLLASLHSIAQQDPSVIQDMIQDNGDGTYTVTFHEPVEIFGMTFWREVEVVVSGPFDGAHPGDVAGGKQEIWPAIIEKAYVEHFHPEFANEDAIWPGNQGVLPGDAMDRILGPGSGTTGTGDVSSTEMADKLADGEVVVAWTPPFTDDDGNSTVTDAQQELIDHYGIYGGHAYAVSEVIPAGTTYVDPNTGEAVTATEDVVVLDNPHGNGDVLMPYSDYQEVFGWVSSHPAE